MSHSITVRLNKPASEFDAGESVGFGLKGGVKFFDRKTKTEQYTNYEASIFFKKTNQAQIDYHRKMLVEGAIVEIKGTSQAIRQFQGNNGLVLTIELLDASLGLVAMGAPKDQQSANQSQQHYNQAPPQQQQYNQAPPQQQHYNQAPPQQQHHNQAPPQHQQYNQAPPQQQQYNQAPPQQNFNQGR